MGDPRDGVFHVGVKLVELSTLQDGSRVIDFAEG